MSSLSDLPEVVGFFSYSREDDEAFKGSLSALRDGIQRELSAQLGRTERNFRLWQDQEAIAPGGLWESEIKSAVKQAVFFVPIVTPEAVNSENCQIEYSAFLERERELGRTDLVFPILYIGVPALENEAQWRNHPVLSVVGKCQYVDWRQFRHQDIHTTAVREAIERFCGKIVEALNRPWLSPEERRSKDEDEVRQRVDSEAEWRVQDEKARSQAEAEAQRRAGEETQRKKDEAEAQRIAEGQRRQQAEAEQLAQEEMDRIRAAQERPQRAYSEDERRLLSEKLVTYWSEAKAALAAHKQKRQMSMRDAQTLPAPPVAEHVEALEDRDGNSRFEREELAKTKSRFLSDWHTRRRGNKGLLARLFTQRDVVDCTVFAPRMARPEAWISVQVFLHTPEGRTQAEKLATAMDTNTAMRGISTLEVELDRGARVQMQLDVPNAKIDEPVQTLVWQGHTQGRSFRVSLPTAGAGQEFNAKVRFLLEGIPIGWVGFVLACGTNDDGEELVAQGSNARRYMRAFISYASEDRPEVKKRIQALRALKIEFFHDILSLEPGERWERRLYDEIDRCDLFMLFWSRAAGRSEWVGKEIARAMERRRSSAEETPDIAPIALEAFNVAPLPAALSEFHFDSSTT